MRLPQMLKNDEDITALHVQEGWGRSRRLLNVLDLRQHAILVSTTDKQGSITLVDQKTWVY